MGKKTPEINSGSMADISFLLLTFFLLTSSINTDQGISRVLPPPVPKDQKAPDINKRNVMEVLVNQYDQLLINGEPGIVDDLKEKAINFIENPSEDITLSDYKIETIDYLGEVRISKGVISLQNDRGTSYKMYISVQNELTKAYNELRDKLSMQKFGKKYVDITNEDQRKSLLKAIPTSISEAEPKNIGG